MLRKLLLVVVGMIASMGFAFAQVDVNKADAAALDSIKGIGPKMSKTIIDERKKGGDFKDWSDFEKRVKGIGDKNSDKLSQAGLTVGGQSKPNAPAKDVKKSSAKEAKPVMKDAASSKSEMKAEAKDAKASAKADAKDAKK